MNDAVRADTLSILYGKSAMDLRLPREARPTVIGKRPMAKLPDPRAAVRDALARPIGAAPYEALVRGMSAPGRPKRELLPLGGKARSAKGAPVRSTPARRAA